MKTIVGFVGGLIIGGVLGGLGGAKLGTTAVGSNWASTEANNAEEVISILEKHRAKQAEQALEELEVHLNRHLYGLMPQTREGLSIPDKTVARLEEVRKKAKAYRAKHPRPETEDMLDTDVAKFLAD